MPQTASLEGGDYQHMTPLGPILENLGLSQYRDRFFEEGFETWGTLLDITETDFDALQVKRGHRRKLQREIARSRGLGTEQALPSPSQSSVLDDRAREAEESLADNSAAPSVAGSVGKRKYRRHPKNDENAPTKPPSAYVIFSNRIREELNGQGLTFTEIAKRVGERWQECSPEEKEPYETQATAAKQRYHSELAEYKKTEDYKQHAQYLGEFKAKNGPPRTAENLKRPKYDLQQSSASSPSGGRGQYPYSGSQQSALSRTDPASSTSTSDQSGMGIYSASAGQHFGNSSSSMSGGANGVNTYPGRPIGAVKQSLSSEGSSGSGQPNSAAADDGEGRRAVGVPRRTRNGPLPSIRSLESLSQEPDHGSLPPLTLESMSVHDSRPPPPFCQQHTKVSGGTGEDTPRSSHSSGSGSDGGGGNSPGSTNPMQLSSGVIARQRNLPAPISSSSNGHSNGTSAPKRTPPPIQLAPFGSNNSGYTTYQPAYGSQAGSSIGAGSHNARDREPNQSQTRRLAHESPMYRTDSPGEASPNSQMSDVRPTTPFSALLEAGEKIAARDTNR